MGNSPGQSNNLMRNSSERSNNNQMENEAEKYYKEAEELYNNKKYEECLEPLKKAIAISPEIKYYRKQGYAYYFLADYNNSIESFRNILKIDPKDVDAIYWTGFVYRKQQKYEQALKCYQECLEINPKDVDAIKWTGDVYREQQKYEQALKCYQECLEIDPKYALAFYWSGYIYLNKLKDYKKAQQFFEKTLEINPDDKLSKDNLQEAIDLQKELGKDFEEMKIDDKPKEEEGISGGKRYAFIVGNYDYASKYDPNLGDKVHDLPGVEQEIVKLDLLNNPNRLSLKQTLQKRNFQVEQFLNVVAKSKDFKNPENFGLYQIERKISKLVEEAEEEDEKITILFCYQGHGMSPPNSQDSYALCTDYQAYNIDFLGTMAAKYNKCTMIGIFDSCRNVGAQQYFKNATFLNRGNQANASEQMYFVFRAKETQFAEDYCSITKTIREAIVESPGKNVSELSLEVAKNDKRIETKGGYCDFKF